MDGKYKLEIRAYYVFEGFDGDEDLELDSTLKLEFDTLNEAKKALNESIKYDYCAGMFIKAYINSKCYFNDILHQ